METDKFVAGAIVVLIAVVLMSALGVYVAGIYSSKDVQSQNVDNSNNEYLILNNGSSQLLNIPERNEDKFSITSSSAIIHNQSWMNFDGVDDIVNASAIPLRHDINFLTISLWFKTFKNDTSYSGRIISILYNSTEQFAFGIRNTNAKLEGAFHNGTSGAYWGNTASVYSIGTNRWYNVILVFNGTLNSSKNGNNTFYLDNVEHGSWSNIGGAGGVSSLALGAKTSDNDNDVYFNGMMDEVRIYNRSLNGDEVTAIYSSGRKANSSLPSDGLILWYSFDEGDGSIVYDKSGNGNNGT